MLSMKRSERRIGKTDEIALIMPAHRTDRGRAFARVNVTAVQAHPSAFAIARKELFAVGKRGIACKTFTVCAFDFGNHAKGCGDVGKALFLGFL